MNPELIKIIIADDDRDDAMLLIEVLEKNGIDREKFILAEDGEKLLSLLPEYAKIPSLVFLDLNMPLKNGLQVLSEIKADPSLKHIPVMILTTSNAAKDVRHCYELGASTYFTKPGTYTEMLDLAIAIKGYWLERATLS